MKKVFELLNKKQVKGDVGIEIECEGEGMDAVDTALWKSEDDGSLRGVYPETRAEYILKKPIAVGDVRFAVGELQAILEEATFKFSFRTSVHVHLNVQQLTYVQLLNLVYTYLLLEEPMMTFAGKERKGNHFCLRLNDAEGMLDLLNEMFRHGENTIRDNMQKDMYRYSALNLEALGKYGSVEFRGMRGTMDVDVLETWCKAIVALRTYAEELESPSVIFAEYAALEPLAFMQRVFGGVLADKLKYPKVVKDIQRSFSLSLDLPYAYSAYVEEQARYAVEFKDDWKVGDILSYDQAVEFNRRGGIVKDRMDGRYDVTRMAEKPPGQKAEKVAKVAVKKAKPIAADVPVGAGIIRGVGAAPAFNFDIPGIVEEVQW